MFTWVNPYLIGRIYFNDLASLCELSIRILLGGLVYMPLGLLEIRLSQPFRGRRSAPADPDPYSKA